MVVIEMENGGVIKLELDEKAAPKTVENFLKLVKKGFYDGLTFHRIIPGFMIQGGDPNGTGMGGPGYSIKGEFIANGFANDIKHVPGVISMARSMHKDSAGSQFFICVADTPHLDGQYAAFGKCADDESLNNAIELSKVRTGFQDRPIQDQRIKSITIETGGIEYAMPETL